MNQRLVYLRIMTFHSFVIGSLATVAILLGGCAAQTHVAIAPEGTVVYVVRHAEKLDTSADTPLSEIGEARAIALADRLANAHVQRIYATTALRTQQTAGVLAERLGLEQEVMDPGAVDELIVRIKTEDRGKVVLVAGHSNTVPRIVRGLSGQEIEAIPEGRYDRLYRLELAVDGGMKVEELRYGSPTP